MAGRDPVQLLCGAPLLGAATALPLALGSGQFIDPRPPWGAMAVMFVGLFLVQPRRAAPLVRAREVGQDAV